MQAAEQAIPGSPPLDLAALGRQCLELATAFLGWRQRVNLTWGYGGTQVDVVGDAVGSWDQRVPLTFDVRRRLWRLQLWVSAARRT